MNRKADTDILIIGAGASGLAAACAAASAGVSVIVADGNDRTGKKLSATGNGRCNLTNTNCTPQSYNDHAEMFVDTVFKKCNPGQTRRFFNENGMLIREEQEGRCYPYSGQASAVTELLTRKAESLGTHFLLGDAVLECSLENGVFSVVFASEKRLTSRSLILATGGRAGLHFGSTGDGYGFARSFGHSLNAPRPALVACESEDSGITGMKGRARAEVTLFEDGQRRYTEYGEVQFTGSGLSGICVMNLTRYMDAARPVQKKKKRSGAEPAAGFADNKKHEYRIEIDFIPEYQKKKIMVLLTNSLKTVSLETALSRLVNDRIASVIFRMSGGAVERAVELLKNYPVTIRQTKGWKDAQVTCGGIRLQEISPETMGSVLTPGLFFCGELVDVDGPCGGYNLQWAWSSGYLSGVSAAEYVIC